MAEVVRQRSGIVAIVRQLIPARVPQHVRVHAERQPCSFAAPRNHPQEPRGRHWCACLGHEHVGASAPVGAEPHPIVVYFHGGGWVLGDQQSDDPFCRDMCRRTGMIFVSVGYRHAPEHRFPTAAEDGYAATRCIAEHAAKLGGIPGPVLVAGWSAGGNIAAVTCQLARDRGGPRISGQLLVCPVTDCVFDRLSYNENATGYFLTRSLRAESPNGVSFAVVSASS